MIYACRNAWALLPEMMVTGMGIGLIAGGIGYAYHRPRETARGPRSTRVFDFRALLLPVPLVWLGGVFCVLLVSGLNLLVVGMAMVLASGVSIAVSVVGLGLEARRSRSA